MKIERGIAERKALLERIVSCPVAEKVLHQPAASLNREELNCVPIVASQLMATGCGPAGASASAEENANRWLVPEPWNGHLGQAPLLFIGQNPSADFAEDYPTLGETRSGNQARDPVQYFESRFDGVWIRNGTQVRFREPVKGKGYAGPNRFLSKVKELATQFHDRDALPGIDYALTEAVRCKAKDAIGVRQAIATCAVRYLKETISLSRARVIVCMGGAARRALLVAFMEPTKDAARIHALEKQYKFGQAESMATFSGMRDDQRRVVFLQHSGARGEFVPPSEAVVESLRPLLQNTAFRSQSCA